MIKAIILDLDDTLLDTTEQLSESWEGMLAQILHEKKGISLKQIKLKIQEYRKIYLPQI